MIHSANPPLSALADESVARSILDLSSYPDVPGDVLCRHARLLGQAGEAFADSLFMRAGIVPLRMPEGVPSDRLFLLPLCALKAQIKIQSRARGDTFVFHLRRGYRGSPAGCRAYERGDFDLAILVILPLMVLKVVYNPGSTVRIPLAEISDLQARPLESFWRAVHACQEERASGLEHGMPPRSSSASCGPKVGRLGRMSSSLRPANTL